MLTSDNFYVIASTGSKRYEGIIRAAFRTEEYRELWDNNKIDYQHLHTKRIHDKVCQQLDRSYCSILTIVRTPDPCFNMKEL